jgi:cellulose synthase/poly-beta-1,6-N-acetylglucosamine synthase-like glycosyltransferase
MNSWLSIIEPIRALFFQPQAGILAFLGGLLLVALSNLRKLKSIEAYPEANLLPTISVLVPARNEALNIETCLTSLLAQNYDNYEVIALDDESQDDTGAILKRLSQTNPRLKILSGTPLPAGWVGKPWACQQLAEAARGELLLFTDADTRHHPKMLLAAAGAQQASGADFISGMPRARNEKLGRTDSNSNAGFYPFRPDTPTFGLPAAISISLGGCGPVPTLYTPGLRTGRNARGCQDNQY